MKNFAELAVIGSVLCDAALSSKVCTALAEEMFAVPECVYAFRAIKKMHDDNRKIDLTTLSSELEASGHDLVSFLTGAYDYVVTTANIDDYISDVQRAYQRREFSKGLQEAHRALEHGDDSCYEIARRAADNARSAGKSKATKAADILPNAIELLGDKTAGIRTGFRNIDIATNGGLKEGQFAVIGARPSVGKTSFACNMAANMAKQGKTVLYFTLEMSKEDVLGRMVLTEAERTRGQVFAGKTDAITEKAMPNIEKWNLFLDDTTAPTVGQIATSAYQVKQREGKLDCIFVDYMGLIESLKKNSRSRQEEVSEVSRALKLLAREIKCPVVALCQLNRGVETRATKEPVLSDLRESGSIEQDTDIVVLLHRPWVHDKNADPTEAQYNIAKNRNGATGTVNLRYIAEYTLFKE